MTNFSDERFQISQSFHAEFSRRARNEEVAICPVQLPPKTTMLTGLVYQETYNYRSLQVFFGGDPGNANDLRDIDYHFDEIGQFRENQLLTINIQRPPKSYEAFWNVRKLWMRSDSSRDQVSKLLNALVETSEFL